MSRFGVGFLGGHDGNDQYTKILLHLDGNLDDTNVGGSPHTWTAHGSSFVTSGQKFGTGALQCPYIDAPAHTDFNLGSGDWTVDFWFDTLGIVDAVLNLCGQTSSGTAANTAFYALLTAVSPGNMVLAIVISDGTSLYQITGTTIVNAAGLRHAEFCRTGNTIKLFLDGAQEGGGLAFTGSVNSLASAFSIGRKGTVATAPFNGLIDEFRLSVGVARHTSNFTPPTTPYY